MDHEDRDEYDGRDSRVIGVYSNIDDQRKGMSETTHSITESEVKEISSFMKRMGTKSGRAILARRRKKGRKTISA